MDQLRRISSSRRTGADQLPHKPAGPPVWSPARSSREPSTLGYRPAGRLAGAEGRYSLAAGGSGLRGRAVTIPGARRRRHSSRVSAGVSASARACRASVAGRPRAPETRLASEGPAASVRWASGGVRGGSGAGGGPCDLVRAEFPRSDTRRWTDGPGAGRTGQSSGRSPYRLWDMKMPIWLYTENAMERTLSDVYILMGQTIVDCPLTLFHADYPT